MKKYRVHLTAQALDQLREAQEYIAFTLQAPDTALQWLDHMEAAFSSLSTMPLRNPLLSREPWHSMGVRSMLEKNFYVYYQVDEDTFTVWIAAVLYARRDQLSQLEKLSFS